MKEGIKNVWKILDKGHMIETEEGLLHSETDLRVTIIQEDHTDNMITIRDSGENRQQEFRSQSRSAA